MVTNTAIIHPICSPLINNNSSDINNNSSNLYNMSPYNINQPYHLVLSPSSITHNVNYPHVISRNNILPPYSYYPNDMLPSETYCHTMQPMIPPLSNMRYANNKYTHQRYKTYYNSDSRVLYQHIKTN